MKLMGKIFIQGKIETKTGLHIGGSKTVLDIGGIDDPVIKDALGRPYIPGSSLKGKIRSLLERESKLSDSETNPNKHGLHNKGPLAKIFGVGATENNSQGPTRFYARDAYLNAQSEKEMKEKIGQFKELELDYTEGKWENTIDRLTSKASNPRQSERVPAKALFDVEFVFNVFEKSDLNLFIKEVLKGIRLLEDDYIGGSGSRGYGQIEFTDIAIKVKNISHYETDNQGVVIEKNHHNLKLEDLEKYFAG